MLGIGLVMMAVMFFGMFTFGGGPHHMADVHRGRFDKAVETDHSHGKEQLPVMHHGHDRGGVQTGGGDEDKENREP